MKLLPLILVALTTRLIAQPTPTDLAAYNAYTVSVESRLATQHLSPETFLVPTPATHASVLLEHLPTPTLNQAIIHHWRASAFTPGATAADFNRLMRNFESYPQAFAPQVISARTDTQSGDHITASMRLRQHHVLTVVLDTTYDITFSRLDPQHGSSLSRSTRIAEIASPGTPSEHPLTPAEEHGFLWRLNTYWSYVERDGGLYLQVEAISLTRPIPTGLAWAVHPYVESIPRESLEFTIRSTCKALHAN